jgi:hypothetical protein
MVHHNKKCDKINEDGIESCSKYGYPNICSENDWAAIYGHSSEGSWRMIHQYIGGYGLNGNMECQCARLERDTSTEVMFYERKLNTTATNKLSFISYMGDVNIHFWNRSHCEQTGSCNLTEKNWFDNQKKAKEKNWHVNNKLDIAIRDNFTHIIPDVDIAIFNAALWTGGRADVNLVKPILNALFNFTQSHNKKGKCYWKGMAPSKAENMFTPSAFDAHEDDVRNVAYGAGCGVFDVTHVTKDFAPFMWSGDVGRNKCCGEKELFNVYFDSVHFQPWVNEELNNILLNVLC